MSVKLYIDAMSQPCRALMMFVRMTSLPCQEVQIALRKGEHMSDEYKAINPFQKVPAMEDGSFKLTESVAIFRYLCRKFPVPDHWYPKDSEKQARVDEYMSWQHMNLRTYGSMFFQHKVIIPRLTGNPVNEKQATFFQNGLENVLDQMDTIWLKENQYIAGKEISVADLLCVAELEQPGMGGFDVKSGHPKLEAYMERVKQLLQPHYDDVHKYVYKLKELAKNQAKL